MYIVNFYGAIIYLPSENMLDLTLSSQGKYHFINFGANILNFKQFLGICIYG